MHILLCSLIACSAVLCMSVPAGKPVIAIQTGVARAEITSLSWDTEGTGREKTNL
jgi:hypothetical protein